jgi:hypothetical protein
MTRIAILNRPEDQLDEAAHAAIELLRSKNIGVGAEASAKKHDLPEQARRYIRVDNDADVEAALSALSAAGFDVVRV